MCAQSEGIPRAHLWMEGAPPRIREVTLKLLGRVGYLTSLRPLL
jgi:hypothetical protein